MKYKVEQLFVFECIRGWVVTYESPSRRGALTKARLLNRYSNGIDIRVIEVHADGSETQLAWKPRLL